MAGDPNVAEGRKRRHRDEDLDSEFDFGSGVKRKTWNDDPLAHSRPSDFRSAPNHSVSLPSKQLIVSERDKEEWRARRFHYLAMDTYSRHKALVNQYLLFNGRGIEHFKRSTENDRNDFTVLAEEHKFLWEPGEGTETWEKRLAKAYYDKLFKEYAITDLSRYKENKVALRWRIEKEVCDGKGQFICGNKSCIRTENLTSWEVNFAYREHSEQKNALVKLRLCRKCSKKLNYHKKCKKWKKSKVEKKRKKKHKVKGEAECDRIEAGAVTPPEDGESSTDEEHDDEQVDDDDGGSGQPSGGASDHTSIWNKPAEAFLEKSKTEEFQEYFKDMFL